MNVLFFLKPKQEVCVLHKNYTLRQGIEKLRQYGFAAVPVIDDEWIQKNMPMYKDLAAMREDFGKKINKERQAYYEDYKRNLAAGALAQRFEGSIPDEIYEGAMREQQKNLRQQVAASGQSWEEFCEKNGGE